jgi:hypothetical protein
MKKDRLILLRKNADVKFYRILAYHIRLERQHSPILSSSVTVLEMLPG